MVKLRLKRCDVVKKKSNMFDPEEIFGKKGVFMIH
uniref:Ribosomal protein S16 n=1 Tax=Lupinus albus TaxID=3870 RepID=A0A3Q8AJ10_LUPAL|nr:ribosomal protein S16 [Lupinus albus]